MQRTAKVLHQSIKNRLNINQQANVIWQPVFTILAVAAVILVVTFNLTDYPTTWYDEGSHLHVPKTLVRYGVYADYSSEGLRHYAPPTIGIGPTVLLPIAAAFRIFGVGLLQARLVMALYLLATILVFYHMARELGGRRQAWIASALLISSQGISLLHYGRQVLGEVPGFFFLGAGLALWFTAWERPSWRRLAAVGLLLGLATVTKSQYLLILAPTLGVAWLTNLLYYRLTPQRVFILPGLLTGACYGFWQVYMILFLGPSTTGENLALLREITAGAALVFSPALMKLGLQELLSYKVYLGALVPALVYGFFLALPRRREGQQWGVLWILIAANLVWYVVASISWVRYAFPGLAMASLFVARFFHDLTDGFQLEIASLWTAVRDGRAALQRMALRWVMLVWLIIMAVLPFGQTLLKVVAPPFNAPDAMATYLNKQIPRQALIETWEPEMGFLTDHHYHFPPDGMLNKAVSYAWLGGPPPSQTYDFVKAESPEYVLVGDFARGVDFYPADLLTARYSLVTSIGGYELFALDE